MKTAVVLFNLGGPDSKESIRPFLFNFFMDPNIVRLPFLFRFLLAWRISVKRSGNEAGKSYALLGNRSPLLDNSRAQAAALEKALGPGFKIFVCMRYWHPMADEVVREVRAWEPDKIILLPLYPQFSTTTTWSSLGVWKKAMRNLGYDKPTSLVCCYPFNQDFIKASAENIRPALEKMPGARVLFSAHGLPESIIRGGDPYQWQCAEGAKKIAALLDLEDWAVCYQSRVGRQKWIGPSTEEELRRAARDQKPVVIYPIAFTQEHVETLVEIEIEYRELAHKLGVPGFARAAAVSAHPVFIDGLAKLVKDHLDGAGISGEGGKQICPPQFHRCCMRSAA